MKPRTIGEALVRLLVNHGVDTVFGIPGVHTLELYRGLPGSGIRHVLTRHEQGAGFMADGYARSTGKPGVCFVISGPGVTNIATAIGQAHGDSIPLFVISSVNTRPSLGKGWGHLHECQDQASLTSAITAFSATATCEQDVPELVARAFSVFASQRPRPVHLSIPLDLLGLPASSDWTADVRPPVPRPTAAPSAVAVAARLLERAQRPVIIAGGGAVDAGASLQALAQKLQAPVFSTVAAKGILPVEHPLYMGSVLCTPAGWSAIEAADVVLAVGTEMAETDFWREKLVLSGPLIRLDIDPRKIQDLYPCAMGLIGDARSGLQALDSAIPQARADDNGHVANTRATVQSLQGALAPLQRAHKAVWDVVARTLPTQALVSSDMTQLAYSGNYLFEMGHPRSWLHPTGFGTLGYGLPAGIGAQIAQPDRPVLVVAGDGGLMYSIAELATAVEEVRGVLVVLVWNNQALGQIRDDMVDLAIEPVGVLPRAPDFVGLGKAMGCDSVKPTSWAQFENELSRCWRSPGVHLIELAHSLTPLT